MVGLFRSQLRFLGVIILSVLLYPPRLYPQQSSPGQVEKLLAAASSTNRATSQRAWQTLVESRERVASVLISRMKPSDPRFRQIVHVVGRLGPPSKAVPVFIRGYEQSLNADVRRAYISALHGATNPGVVPLLVDALQDTGPAIRRDAWAALAGFSSEAVKDYRSKIMEASARGLEDLMSAPSVLRVIDIAGGQPPSFFLPFLGSEDVPVCMAAIHVLARHGDPQVVEALRKMARDKERQATIRMAALAALAAVSDGVDASDWLDALRAEDTRGPALSLLGQAAAAGQVTKGVDEIERVLIKFSSTNNDHLAPALTALARLGGPRASRALRALAMDRRRPLAVRLLSIEYLAGKSQAPRSHEDVLLKLAANREEDREIRLAALKMLVHAPKKELIPVLGEFSASSDPETLAVVASGLRWAPPSPPVTNALLNLYPTSRDKPYRKDILLGLARSKDSQARRCVMDWIVGEFGKDGEGLRQKDLAVLVTQLRWTGEASPGEITKALITKAADPDPKIRVEALAALDSLGPEYLLPWMDQWLSDPDEQVAAFAVACLGSKLYPECLTDLFKALGDQRKRIAIAALQQLGAYRYPKVVPEIIRKLKSDDKEIRRAAAIALCRLTLNVFGTPGAQPPPRDELVVNHDRWEQWWKDEKQTFDFVGRFLHVLKAGETSTRIEVTAEIQGAWARDRRLADYLISRLDTDDRRERHFVTFALQYALEPDTEVVDALLANLPGNRNPNLLALLARITGREFRGFMPDPQRPNEMMQLFEAWWNGQTKEWKTWWKKNRENYRRNEAANRKKFLESFQLKIP